MGAFMSYLAHSAGVQSNWLLEMVLRGEIEKPSRFVVINADPGMEDVRTLRFVRDARRRCQAAGIDYITAAGPNLYADIVNMISNGATRLDNPPFWIAKIESAKTLNALEIAATVQAARTPLGFIPDFRSKLKQGCTGHYKIAPMRAALRRYLAQKHNVSHGQLRPGMVEAWIGFAADEWHRCSDSDVAYISHRYPLIEVNMDREAIERRYDECGVARPPRSVCSGCFSNGLDFFRDMYFDRPDNWAQAVDVDNAVENWHLADITQYPVFVCGALVRLRDLPALDFGGTREDLSEHHCNSGVCFL